jgi:hypothetical protein
VCFSLIPQDAQLVRVSWYYHHVLEWSTSISVCFVVAMIEWFFSCGIVLFDFILSFAAHGSSAETLAICYCGRKENWRKQFLVEIIFH